MEFTHFDDRGNTLMVDIRDKTETRREAVAKGGIFMSPGCLEEMARGTMVKGGVLGAIRVTGIMRAKRTSDLIPLYHILNLTKLTVDFTVKRGSNEVEAVRTAKTTGKTKVEMEALTGVSMVLLAVYDIYKVVDKSMEIGDIYLEHKSGGKNGESHNPRCARNRGRAI